MRVARALPILLLAACAGPSERDVRATILDEAGQPVAGAVLYAEARDDSGPFAFLSGVAGTAGAVPQTAREPLKLGWRPGSEVVLAAFAPGYRPTVVVGGDRLVTDGALLVLHPGEEADPGAVAPLGFPFEGNAPLTAEAAAPAHDALREALRRARGKPGNPLQ